MLTFPAIVLDKGVFTGWASIKATVLEVSTTNTSESAISDSFNSSDFFWASILATLSRNNLADPETAILSFFTVAVVELDTVLEFSVVSVDAVPTMESEIMLSSEMDFPTSFPSASVFFSEPASFSCCGDD